MKNEPLNLTDPIFSDEEKARAHFEAIRWPNGPACPHCGVVNQATLIGGEKHRPGLYQCNACREPFTVTVGTVMESSHIPLHKWALGFHLMASSKKGVSAHQLFRTLGLGSYRTAWFMAHRIREAMKDVDPTPMGGDGKTVEADETYLGKQPDVFINEKGWQKKRSGSDMRKVLTLVERGGRARSLKIDTLQVADMRKALAIVSRQSALMTDEARHYRRMGKEFKSHDAVNHSEGEYVRGHVTTNTVEGFFSIFKRGMVGVYQHCGDRDLPRYLAEFDFRYSNRVALGVDDVLRTMRAIKGAEGKRLTYRQPRTARPA